MRGLLAMLVLFTALGALPSSAAPLPPASLDQIKAEGNPERRARLAIDFSTMLERDAEAAYASNDLNAVSEQLKMVTEAMELAESSLEASHKTPGRNPGPYKYGELRSRELLMRMGDLQKKMDAEERPMIDAPIARIQKIHDEWFDGIMGRKK